MLDLTELMGEDSAETSTETKQEESTPEDTEQKDVEEKLSSLDDTQRKVYSLFEEDAPLTADDLCSDDISAAEVLSALTMLEIEGLIEAIPGGLYKKK